MGQNEDSIYDQFADLGEDYANLLDAFDALAGIALEFERALERIAGPRGNDPSTIRRTVAAAALRDHRERLREILRAFES